jgi:hypothetical protein
MRTWGVLGVAVWEYCPRLRVSSSIFSFAFAVWDAVVGPGSGVHARSLLVGPSFSTSSPENAAGAGTSNSTCGIVSLHGHPADVCVQ